MTDEPKKPNSLNICELHDASILMTLLGEFVSLIRVCKEDFFEKPDDSVLQNCDWIKKQFGIVNDTGFGNYIEAVEALIEFEEKYGFKEIKVPGPLEFYDSERLSYFYCSFSEVMEKHCFRNNAINRELLTLILKAIRSLY